jgi:hypothetical protein
MMTPIHAKVYYFITRVSSQNATSTLRKTTMADSSAAAAAAQKLAEDSLRAIRELERVLLFTDLKEEDAVAATQALKDLQSVTESREGEAKLDHFINILPARERERPVDETKQEQPEPRAVTSPNMSTALLMSLSAKWQELMDRLRHHLEATLESGSQTLKETERKLLFTDLDEIYAKHDALSGRPTSYRSRSTTATATTTTTTTLAKPDNRLNMTMLLLQIQDQVKVLLKELELKMSGMQQTTAHAVKECERTLLFTDLPDNDRPNSDRSKPNVTLLLVQVQDQLNVLLKELELKMSGVQQTTTKAVKECERTLLFTDLPDQAPLRSKQDAVHHFVNSQQVMEEIQRKVLFTDCK